MEQDFLTFLVKREKYQNLIGKEGGPFYEGESELIIST